MSRPSWGRILLLSALALSLVLNFFLAGFIVRSAGVGTPFMNRIARAYPEDFRDAFRAAMRDGRPQTLQAVLALRRAHLDLAAAVSAEPRDAAAVKAAEDEVTRATDALQALVRTYFEDALDRTKGGG